MVHPGHSLYLYYHPHQAALWYRHLLAFESWLSFAAFSLGIQWLGASFAGNQTKPPSLSGLFVCTGNQCYWMLS